uniref:Globin family profile domain-containing protein n=1 Tax=Panagrellus redivivus TaxID=6233 RepID=A0A7E4VSX5_PANRE
MDRRQSVNTGRVCQPPTIRVGTSISFNEGLIASGTGNSSNSLQVDRPQISRGRSGSACSERSNSIKGKHPVSIRYRQLIASCFQNPHEVVGRKILKRTVEMRSDFAKFYFAATQEQREELEESIKVLLKKTVCNIDFLDEMKRMAEDFGEKLVHYRSAGFKADFFSCLADATIKECTFLDNAVHPAHQTLSAFSQFITMVFSSVRDGFYNEMRRLRRASNSFSTGSGGSRKKTSIDSNSNFELALPSRSASPSGDSRLSDECFTPTVHECEEGFLKPPTMVSARMC